VSEPESITLLLLDESMRFLVVILRSVDAASDTDDFQILSFLQEQIHVLEMVPFTVESRWNVLKASTPANREQH
jgi:hypothetical protein